MTYQHFEALQPARSSPAWAVLFVNAHGHTLVLFGSMSVEDEVSEFGPLADDLPLELDDREPLTFCLWEGRCNFDGLDSVDYTTHSVRELAPQEISGFIHRRKERDNDNVNDAAGSARSPGLLDF